MIHADPTSIKVRPSGPATGAVWVTISGHDFPARGWRDFAVVVLGGWVAAVLRLLRRQSTQELVNFFDGPYAVEVAEAAGGRFRFRALEGPGRRSEVVIGEEPAAPFTLQLLSASRAILAACRHQMWWSSDAEALANALVALEEEVAKIPHPKNPHQG